LRTKGVNEGPRPRDATNSTSCTNLSDQDNFEFDFGYTKSKFWAKRDLKEMDYRKASRVGEETFIEDGMSIKELRGNNNDDNNNNTTTDNNHFNADQDERQNDSEALSVCCHSRRETTQELKLGIRDSLNTRSNYEKRSDFNGDKTSTQLVRQTNSEVVPNEKFIRNATLIVRSKCDERLKKNSKETEEIIAEKRLCCKSPSRCSERSRQSNVSLFNDNEIWTPKPRLFYDREPEVAVITDASPIFRKKTTPIKEVLAPRPIRNDSTEDVAHFMAENCVVLEGHERSLETVDRITSHKDHSRAQLCIKTEDRQSGDFDTVFDPENSMPGRKSRSSHLLSYAKVEVGQLRKDIDVDRVSRSSLSQGGARFETKNGAKRFSQQSIGKSGSIGLARSRSKCSNHGGNISKASSAESKRTDYFPARRDATSLNSLRRIDFAAASPPPQLECCMSMQFDMDFVLGSNNRKRNCRSLMSREREATRVNYVGKFIDDPNTDSSDEKRAMQLTRLRSQSSGCIEIRGRPPRRKGEKSRKLFQRLPSPSRTPSSTTFSASSSVAKETANQQGMGHKPRNDCKKRREIWKSTSPKTYYYPGEHNGVVSSKSDHRPAISCKHKRPLLQQISKDTLPSPYRYLNVAPNQNLTRSGYSPPLPACDRANYHMQELEQNTPIFSSEGSIDTQHGVAGEIQNKGDARSAKKWIEDPQIRGCSFAEVNARLSDGAAIPNATGTVNFVNDSRNANCVKGNKQTRPIIMAVEKNSRQYTVAEEAQRKRVKPLLMAVDDNSTNEERNRAEEESDGRCNEKKKEKKTNAIANARDREWQGGRAAEYQRSSGERGKGGFEELRKMEALMNGSGKVIAEERGKSVNRAVDKEEGQISLAMKHLKENRVLYLRVSLAIAVIFYWNWQSGGFGAKREFLRNLQSASVTAAAAATVADGIAAAERQTEAQ